MYVDEFNLSKYLDVSTCVYQGQNIPPAEYAKASPNSKWCHRRFTVAFKAVHNTMYW